MIESPTHHVTDLLTLIRTSSTSCARPSDAGKILSKTRLLLRENSVHTYFIRISWTNKLIFLTKLAESLRSIESISLILSTLYHVSGKICSYAKISTKSDIAYDTVLNDHSRMLPDEMFEEVMTDDLIWFRTLKDKDQIALFIGLLRFSGGALIQKLHARLHRIHSERLRDLAILENRNDENEQEEDVKAQFAELEKHRRESTIFPDYDHNPNDPNHKNCLRLIKNWDDVIGKYKKEIQLLPIGIVKMIFSYLDKKSLKKAKKVDEYWKWVITDLTKELKLKKLLNKTKKKMKESSEGKCTFPNDPFLKEPKPRVDFTEKRMRKMYNRGAILEKLRYISTAPLNQHYLIHEVLE
ncbi:uncharacterized protein BDFB_013602, partial [Asbolus verrucosus]